MKKDNEAEVTNQVEAVVHVQMGTIKTLLLILPAMLALVGGGIAWGNTGARLEDSEQEITELQFIVRGQEARLRAQENIGSRNEAVFISIDKRLIEIKQDLRGIKDNK